jgi:hypothetical protein
VVVLVPRDPQSLAILSSSRICPPVSTLLLFPCQSPTDVPFDWGAVHQPRGVSHSVILRSDTEETFQTRLVDKRQVVPTHQIAPGDEGMLANVSDSHMMILIFQSLSQYYPWLSPCYVGMLWTDSQRRAVWRMDLGLSIGSRSYR